MSKSAQKRYHVWIPSRVHRLGGFPAIQYNYPPSDDGKIQAEYEICLASKYGEIWPKKQGVYGLVCKSGKIAAKIAKTLGIDTFSPLSKKDEEVFTVTEKQLPAMISLMKIPKSRPSQARHANNF